MVDYGKSVQGRTLRLVLLRRPGFFKYRSTLVMSGVTHGNEYLNIEDRLPRALMNEAKTAGPVSRFLDQGGVYVFIPIINPDGYENRNRNNAHGVDLNRDWSGKTSGVSGFQEPETRALALALESLRESYNLRYQITVDYHCCVGALLHPWSNPDGKAFPIALSRKHQAIGELALRHLDVPHGTTGEMLGYFPVGTSKDYYLEKYQAAAFTFEGRQLIEGTRLEQHVTWWRQMTELVLDGAPLPASAAGKNKKRRMLFAD